MKTANLYVRIDPNVKKEAESILSALGIQASSAINMFYKQIILHGGLPFDVKIPDELPRGMRKLTEEETKEIIVAGTNDVAHGRTVSATEAFDIIHKELKI